MSVVLSVYNGEKFLRDALESVFSQTYEPLEVIVVDDGSTDKTAEIAVSFESVQYLHQLNQGTAAARNAGLARATGEFLALLDADDIWTVDKLQIQVEYLKEHSDVDLIFAYERFFSDPGVERPSWIREDLWNKTHPAYIPSALLARRCIFERVGGFNLSYKSSPETEWLFRAKDMGISMAVIPKVLLLRRIHQENVSYAAQSMMKDRMMILRASVKRQRGQ